MLVRTRAGKGFTLIEVLLVIVLLGALATVAFVTLGGTGEKSKIRLTRTAMQKIESALQKYKFEVGTYPTPDDQGLEALIRRPDFETEEIAEKWGGPYLRNEDLTDQWNSRFQYELVEDESSGVQRTIPQLTSFGPDREEGTEDDIVWPEREEE